MPDSQPETDADADTDAAVARLRSAGCVYAEEEVALLAEASRVGGQLDRPGLRRLLDRRVAGEPLEQILGWAEFCGLRLIVRPGVFVPRTRTALLVAEAAARCNPGDLLLDLCCGVGAVAAAVADRTPGRLEVYATDLDPVAVSCARANLGAGCTVGTGDLYAPLPDRLRGRVSVITANAPYVPTEQIALMPAEARDHEARAALDGGQDGLDLHRRVIAGAASWLRPGGALLVETGRDQAPVDLGLLEAAGFAGRMVTDEAIDGTVVIGTRPADPGSGASGSGASGSGDSGSGDSG